MTPPDQPRERPADSRTYYDELVGRQLRVGVNERHRSIRQYLLRFGLEPHHRVLEIGAGVGTLTGLIAEVLDESGSLLALDLSPKSIEAGRARLADHPQVRMEVADALEEELDGPFDVVVLPDVLEHIPLDRHPELFRRMAGWIEPDGFVLCHYPNPHHLAWYQRHRPEDLQFIDEPVWADALTAAAYPAGFTLEYLETYSIWVREGDYQVALFRPRPDDPVFHALEHRPTLRARMRDWLRYRLGIGS